MGISYNNLLPLIVCLGFAAVLGFFYLMYRWARKQKGIAMAFGMLVQMFLPDPKVQQTIEIVTESKQEQKNKSGQIQRPKSKKPS
jgi:hypothetical protein